MSFTIRSLTFKPKDRRFKFFSITPDLLFGLMFNPKVDGDIITALKVDGLPDDAVIEAMSYDPMRDVVHVRVWSSTFDVVLEGQNVPEFEPSFIQQTFKRGERVMVYCGD